MTEREYDELFISEAKEDLLDIDFYSIPINAKLLKRTSSGLTVGSCYCMCCSFSYCYFTYYILHKTKKC